MRNRSKLTRGRLIIAAMKVLLEKYPLAWSVAELTLALGQPQRNVSRAVADMVDGGLIEKHYNGYRISLKIIQEIYGAQWYVRKEIDKTLWLKKRRTSSPEP